MIFEFTSPGAVAPGVVGTIALLLGLYALNLLPIDYAGLALMLLGLTFLIVEAFNPTVVLGLGGLAAFLLGTAMLFKVEAPGFRLSPTIVGAAADPSLRPCRFRRPRALARPALVAVRRRAGDARPAGGDPRLAGWGRPRARRWRTLAGPRRRNLRPRRDGRGRDRRRPDPDGAASVERNGHRRRAPMTLDFLPYLLVAVIAVIFLSAAIRILREYQRGVIFTLGRFTGVKGPGLIILVPFVQQMVKVDLRVVVHNVPPQDVISRDNVSVKVNAVLYFRIVDPERAIIKVEDYHGRDQPARADDAALRARQARARRDAGGA